MKEKENETYILLWQTSLKAATWKRHKFEENCRNFVREYIIRNGMVYK
jgi:hypothetical protein